MVRGDVTYILGFDERNVVVSGSKVWSSQSCNICQTGTRWTKSRNQVIVRVKILFSSYLSHIILCSSYASIVRRKRICFLQRKL